MGIFARYQALTKSFKTLLTKWRRYHSWRNYTSEAEVAYERFAPRLRPFFRLYPHSADEIVCTATSDKNDACIGYDGRICVFYKTADKRGVSYRVETLARYIGEQYIVVLVWLGPVNYFPKYYYYYLECLSSFLYVFKREDGALCRIDASDPEFNQELDNAETMYSLEALL